jgi:rhodanese-related sulfurtransferase
MYPTSAPFFDRENVTVKPWDSKQLRRLLGILAVLGLLLPASAAAMEVLSDEARRLKVEAMYEDYKRAFPEVGDISAEEALKLHEESKVIFVDERDPEEQAVSMLPGAVTADEFLEDPEKYRGRLVVGYCTISYRSGKLARKLGTKGITMVNLRGGILAWLHAGGKVYRDGKPVKRVHVYGRKWDLAPAEYETVW